MQLGCSLKFSVHVPRIGRLPGPTMTGLLCAPPCLSPRCVLAPLPRAPSPELGDSCSSPWDGRLMGAGRWLPARRWEARSLEQADTVT